MNRTERKRKQKKDDKDAERAKQRKESGKDTKLGVQMSGDMNIMAVLRAKDFVQSTGRAAKATWFAQEATSMEPPVAAKTLPKRVHWINNAAFHARVG